MSDGPLFSNAYPRGGQVAILCEGDAVGYEAKLLKQWADTVRPGGRLVDVWPCGTGEALFGMADAIGRTIRFVVLEDRDFRSQMEVDAHCKRKKAERAERDLAILDWRCWRRNEVENYFLDEDVLIPVMAEVFQCSDAEVRSAVEEAVRLLVPFQALQAAFHKTRDAWQGSDPARVLLGPSRPQWKATGLEPVDPARLEGDLKTRLETWWSRVCGTSGPREPWKGDDIIIDYKQNLGDWEKLHPDSPVWRETWAGKEVLKLVRQQLCTLRAGWWSVDPDKSLPVAWHAMKNNAERDARDRKVEREVLPRLVNSFVGKVTGDSPNPRRAEFDELAQVLAG
jgi:hypothetical protein